MRQTTAYSNYNGLLTQFRHEGGRAGTYTLQLHAEPQHRRRRRTIATPSTFRRTRGISTRSTRMRAPIAGTSSTPPTSSSCRSSRTPANVCSRRRLADGRSPGYHDPPVGRADLAHHGQHQRRSAAASGPIRWAIRSRRAGRSRIWFDPAAFAADRRRHLRQLRRARRSASPAATRPTWRSRRTSTRSRSACSSAPTSSTRSTTRSGSRSTTPARHDGR